MCLCSAALATWAHHSQSSTDSGNLQFSTAGGTRSSSGAIEGVGANGSGGWGRCGGSEAGSLTGTRIGETRGVAFAEAPPDAIILGLKELRDDVFAAASTAATGRLVDFVRLKEGGHGGFIGDCVKALSFQNELHLYEAREQERNRGPAPWRPTECAARRGRV